MVSTFVALNRITISRLFRISALIALLLTEKMFADRLIRRPKPMAVLVPTGIATVGRLFCLPCIGGGIVMAGCLAISHAAFKQTGP